MGSKKKVIIFLGVLALLAAFSTLLIFKGKPTSSNLNPLAKVERTELARLVIDNPKGRLEFENQNQKWRMTHPVVDNVSEGIMDRMLTSLTSFYMGSVISENKNNWEKFNLSEGSATHVQVFKIGQKSNPELDLYVGKKAEDYITSFVRLNGKDQVYLAYELSNYIFENDLEFYRERLLVPAKLAEIRSFKFEISGSPVSIYQDTGTWVCAQNNKRLEEPQMADLNGRLSALRAQRFGTEEEAKGILGMKTILKITLEEPQSTMVGFVTDKIQLDPENGRKLHLCRTEGRQGVLFVPESDVKSLIDFLKDISKPAK